MPKVDNQAFYLSALQTHGETAEGVHWASTETQEVRFRVLCSMLPDNLGELRVIDAGCGFGDLYCYMEREGYLPKHYLGLDVMEPMVEAARRRTSQDIRVCDILGEPLPEADVYVCSGAMNTLTREETRRFIEKCLDASRLGFVFNLLKGWNTSPIYNLYLPREIRRLGQELDVDYQIHEGYLSGDFTAAFWKTTAEVA
ncbi:class I SAM-dependent methyltransferase [Thiorhodococcus minor]|uniref:Methyltransferase domain-containing protein n=1 Tax=Thiorhodococcus minor TaxID=57489 RepID=A0A6M0JXY8_9GAMM|nr:class I SAM-dependent methyltransferase [Thiorhodococcus minor]NEV62380.1 methyltransferase domain-containing protein [Thiorhodococcus minor]